MCIAVNRRLIPSMAGNGGPAKSRGVSRAIIHVRDSVTYSLGGIVCVCGDGGRKGRSAN